MDDELAATLGLITYEHPQQTRTIKWCEGHWAELMFALKDRGLGDKIAQDTDALNEKFMKGELDPCWEAHNMLNFAALNMFGPDKIVEENAGCPVCTFANITQHMADLMAMKHGEAH